MAASGKAAKWQVVFAPDGNITGQQVVYSRDYPDAAISAAIDSETQRISDLFFADDHWVLHTQSFVRKRSNQAIRSRPDWEPMGRELVTLGKDKWRIHSITYGTGDWVAILDRPVRDAKPTSWFGGSYAGAAKWLADKGADWYVDYVTWVDEESDYFLACTQDPERAAYQRVFFTSVYPLLDPAVAEHLKTHQIVSFCGGSDGWIVAFGPPSEAHSRTIATAATFPIDVINEKQMQGLWVQCIRSIPSDAP